MKKGPDPKTQALDYSGGADRDRTDGLLNAMRYKCLRFLMFLGYWNGQKVSRSVREHLWNANQVRTDYRLLLL